MCSCFFVILISAPRKRACLIIVAGHAPHKHTVLVLRIDDPEFSDCRFQR